MDLRVERRLLAEVPRLRLRLLRPRLLRALRRLALPRLPALRRAACRRLAAVLRLVLEATSAPAAARPCTRTSSSRPSTPSGIQCASSARRAKWRSASRPSRPSTSSRTAARICPRPRTLRSPIALPLARLCVRETNSSSSWSSSS